MTKTTTAGKKTRRRRPQDEREIGPFGAPKGAPDAILSGHGNEEWGDYWLPCVRAAAAMTTLELTAEKDQTIVDLMRECNGELLVSLETAHGHLSCLTKVLQNGIDRITGALERSGRSRHDLRATVN